MADPRSLPLDAPAIAVAVAPGGEIVLRGALYSSHDGSRIDATTTSWPAGAPGGSSVDPGGLFDLDAGGFHLVSQDPQNHVVRAVAASHDASACAMHGVNSPCLVSRLNTQARTRLMPTSDWYASLHGSVALEVVDPPLYAPALPWAAAMAPVLEAAGVLLASALAVALSFWLFRVRASRPAAVLARLARRVRTKAERAAPLLAAPLMPALDTACRAVRSRSLDPASPQGKRVEQILLRLEHTLDTTTQQHTAACEQRIADSLALEVEIALQAAAEAAHVR